MRDHVCEVDKALEALRIEKEEGTKGRRKALGKSSRSSVVKKKLGAGALRPAVKPV